MARWRTHLMTQHSRVFSLLSSLSNSLSLVLFQQNMKKSWHPRTFHNIERVWKAEQKALAEKRQIEQLQKELAGERARDDIQRMAEDTGHR